MAQFEVLGHRDEWNTDGGLLLGHIPSGGFREACCLCLSSLVIYYLIWGLSLTFCAEYRGSNSILYVSKDVLSEHVYQIILSYISKP